MNGPDQRSAMAIFSEAIEKASAEERAAYLNSVCGHDPVLRRRVEELLAQHFDEDSFMKGPAIRQETKVLNVPLAEGPGTRIGRYKLLQNIGEGGMGVVYMAEQEEPVRRRVALKIIKLGMDTKQVVARFEAERQALALMDHPNIARVLDGGATDTGRPYFVMELVQGVSITEFCDKNHLSSDERIRLFIPVCQAVQSAHQKSIIHRDLKPSNILVTLNGGEAVPKVIDFGIAKATNQKLTEKTLFTNYGTMVGTPAYMSPEQAEMTSLDVDTRTDIYSLGVILYELLTGTTPFPEKQLRIVGYREMQRIILEESPERPSTRLSTMAAEHRTTVAKNRGTSESALTKSFGSDLDWIVMKCLEKDRARRYETANGLASDLRRHLANEPVVARPPSLLYEFRKSVRRHKLGFAAGLVVTFSLILATIVSSRQAVRATHAERQARNQVTQRQRAEEQAKAAALASERHAAESHSQLVRQFVANGNLLVAEGDLLGALPWFAQALKEEEDEPERAKIHRLRLGTTLQQCPKLVQMWFHKSIVNDAEFSPDGRWVVTAGEDGRAQVWDLSSGEPVSPCLELPGPARYTAFSPQGEYVAAACATGGTGVWDVRSGRLLFPLLQPTAGPIQFSPDGRLLLTCGGTAQLWDVATGARFGPPMKHERSVARAAFSRRGLRVITASEDRTAKIWDVATGRLTVPPLKHGEGVTDAEINPDETLAATGSWDGTASIWDAKTGRQLHVLHHAGQVWRVAFNADGTRLITASEDGTAIIWDAITGTPAAPPLKHSGPVADADFSPNGHLVITVSTDGTARAWDSATGRPVSPPLRHWAGLAPISRLGLMRVSFHPDGHQILTVSLDRSARVWDLAGGEAGFSTLKHPTVVVSGSFSPDGSRVRSTSLDGTVYEWDAATAKILSTEITDVDPPEPRGFTRDGQALVQSATNGLTVVRDFESSRAVQLELDSPGRLNHAELDRDGRRIVTAHSDHTARVWDTRTGKATSPPMLHVYGVNYVTFSPDSRLVATASDDETARVWDSSTGEPVTPPLRHNSLVRSVRFGPDGTHLLTSTADGRAQVWALESPSRPLRDDLLLTRLVAAHQVDDTGAYLPVRSELLESAWQDLRPKYGTAFVVTPDQVSAWEQRETATCTDGQAAARARTLWGDGVEFMDLNKWPEAIVAFSNAADLLQAQPPRSILAAAIRDNLATACSQVHRFQDAIRECNEALWRWPNDYWLEGYVSAYHKRAWNHVRLGEFEKAKSDFQKGFALDPGFANYRNRGATYYHNLARAYVLGPVDFRSAEKALPLARKALELVANPIYFNTLGIIYYRLGQFERAAEFLEKNAKTDDALATTWNWLCLAMSFQRLGQTNKAEAYYATATAWTSQNATALRPLDREDLEDFQAEAEAALGRKKRQ